MANRALLHRSRIDDFKAWLREDGWKLEEPKGIYEVVRARKADRKPLIIYTRDNAGSEHITVQGRDEGVIRAYIRDRKRESKAKEHGIQRLPKEKALEVIESRVPTGNFFTIEGKTIIGIDNTTGDAWTEEFKDFDACIQWLNREEERE